ncbi:single-stranded-DNA-specific exonuclease RecJ [Atopobium fossor]|uniref:single-stranded-DNA-specific exonuclease RecJ n=1 Tax=Atopobium fossor TaxID=39487 RepID=UPI00040E9997|nr:single-stranded-DNA-specific exonuclease RecJ [Atopobium fossor]
MAGLDKSKRWEVLTPHADAEQRLQSQLKVSPLVARVMAARGFDANEQAQRFLQPDLDRDWIDPFIIPNMEQGVAKVVEAIAADKTIAVFGDFDVDGMTSTCLLTLALRRMGANHVRAYIPHRFDEGYGLSVAALDRVMEDGKPDLIITVDNGISAAKEVAWLLEQGIDVVITDHHEPADLVPQGVPVVDPKLQSSNCSRELAGAGVALKMVCALGHKLGMPHLWREYTEIACLGTISDMMLLVGENRSLVQDGIRRLRKTSRPGIVALSAVSRVDLNDVTSDSLPFSLIPRLNAAGRMGKTDVALELLLTQDPEQAALLAGELENINQTRREIESSLAQEAMAMVEATYEPGNRVIVIAGEGWHEGVKGIVASRIVNRYHVPSLLFTVSDGIARGSGRSVGSVDLFSAVSKCSDLLVRFGGHSGAVGVTLDAANIDVFRLRMEEELSKLPEDDFVSTGEVTALVGLNELDVQSIDSLEILQPFGQGNKKPLLASTAVCMRGRCRVGGTGEHLRFNATDGIHCVPAIMFRAPNVEQAIDCEGAVDLVFEAVNETWQGRTKPKLMVRDIVYREAPVEVFEQPSIANTLFSRSHAILARGEYEGIAEAVSFPTIAMQVHTPARQSAIAQLFAGQTLDIIFDPTAPNEQKTLVLATEQGEILGELRPAINAALVPLVAAGASYGATVVAVTHSEHKGYGLNIMVVRYHSTNDEATSQAEDDSKLRIAQLRNSLEQLTYEQLTQALRQRTIGDHDFLPAQAAALQQLAAGASTLCVMATGRGKSLIFHIHAAREAIVHKRVSIFVFPLRALVADQAYHLTESFEKIGLSIRVLTGETPLGEREDIYLGAHAGAIDVLLTTPEFLAIHSQRFAAIGRVGFVVVDEAHHAGVAKSGNRSAYTELPRVLGELNNPTCLAVSATAQNDIAQEICSLTGIDAQNVVVDRAMRDNLVVRDERDSRDRDATLIHLVASGEKIVVYVNSREQSVMLARMLRKAVPDLGHKISFYNAGLTRKERKRVEDAFRNGELCCIVSTSAFGEGVNLPDVRDVVLYHMPFGSVEFNQMSGRAGRDGKSAHIYLLFGDKDARINERLLAAGAPDRNALVVLYRTLIAQAKSQVHGAQTQGFSLSNSELAEAARERDTHTELDERMVSCGIAIFRELGLLSTTGYGTTRKIVMDLSPVRVELEKSTRYLEGQHAREEFEQFKNWVLTASTNELLARINRPITPDFGYEV